MVDWPLEDKGSIDMMHTKACAVSNYLDQNNVERGPGVWFSSTNLDTVNYRGANGNNGSQSGVIISNHYEIYNATANFINLMYDYREQEDGNELRDLIRKKNQKQAELILAGKGNEIPLDEQIIYLGTENDKIFELFFTPLSNTEIWDNITNPYCKYISQLYFNSNNDYIEFIWNCPSFVTGFDISERIMVMIDKAFIENKNINNKIQINLPTYKIDNLNTLVVGKDIGYKGLANTDNGVHEKDVVLSYRDNETRHYVSIMSSCNFHAGALGYQTNQILVINYY